MPIVFDPGDVYATVKLLGQYDKLFGAKAERILGDGAAAIAAAARKSIPNVALSNWNNWPAHAPQGFVGRDVQRNIQSGRYRRKLRGRRVGHMHAVVSTDAAGVIFQTAGRGQSKDMFVTNLQANHPMPRGIWAAADGPAGAQLKETFNALVQDVENEMNAKLEGLR